MREINLRGLDMSKKRRRTHRDLRPETTTGGGSQIVTHIPDPRASARFSDGQRCGWLDDRRVMHLGRIYGQPAGDCYARVRMDDGRIIDLPTFSNCLVHVAEPIPGVEMSGLLPIEIDDTVDAGTIDRTPIDGLRTPTHADSGFYESVEIKTAEDIDEMTVPEMTNRMTRRGR